MADKLAAVQAAIAAGKDIVNDLAGVYDAALNFYGKFQGATDFKDRHRSLELALVNGCPNSLEFDSEYFDSGTWFTSPQPLVVGPGDTSMSFVANRQGSVMTGVTGGVKYRISGTNLALYMGFTNPEMGSYKNYVEVRPNDQPARYAYDNSNDDSVKIRSNDYGFRLTCTMRNPKISSFRLFEYTIVPA